MARPQLWVIAGPNGAGKSTLTQKHLVGKLTIINPDELVKDYKISTLEAGRKALELRADCLAQNTSFSIETTMTGNTELKLMQQAKDKGYKVNLVYVGIKNEETSSARVAARVRKGGHDVPEEDILRRYSRSMANLPKAMQLSERTWILDNNGKKPRLLLAVENANNQERVKYLTPKAPNWFKAALGQKLTQLMTLQKQQLH